LQAQRVESIDGKSAMAALRTPWTADQMFSGATAGIGQGSIHDLK
jgi:hypothetical protein